MIAIYVLTRNYSKEGSVVLDAFLSESKAEKALKEAEKENPSDWYVSYNILECTADEADIEYVNRTEDNDAENYITEIY